MANKLYVAAGIEIDPYYANLIKKTFNSSIENVKFENCAETAQVINQWCAEQTHQRIEKIIDPGKYFHELLRSFFSVKKCLMWPNISIY